MTISYYELLKQLVGAFSYVLLDVEKDEVSLVHWWNFYGIFASNEQLKNHRPRTRFFISKSLISEPYFTS